ncbi:MAG TPA: O-antigen ligase family protein, partial [Candidatus Polarisedimenticolaceae bacterium]|nr:O-antigen ligase family protein [Candidatus Polarisedimenticolaceae bacterium]
TITLGLSRGAQVAAVFIVAAVTVTAAWRRRFRPALGVVITALASLGVGLLLISFASVLSSTSGGKHNTAAGNVRAFTKQASNIDHGESSQGRALTRNLALQAAAHNPALGIGPGNFGAYALAQQPTKFNSDDAIVNNEILEVAAENGLTGLLLLLLFVIFMARGAIRAALAEKDMFASLTLWAVLLGLSGVMLQYQLFSTLYIAHIWVAVGLLLGLVRTSKAKA